MATFTAEEVAKHATERDCWIIIGGSVYDVTPFLNEHPGGKKIVLKYAGKDATKEFNGLHKPEVLVQHARLLKGKLAAAAPVARAASAAPVAKAAAPRKAPVEQKEDKVEMYGAGIPFGDPCVPPHSPPLPSISSRARV